MFKKKNNSGKPKPFLKKIDKKGYKTDKSETSYTNSNTKKKKSNLKPIAFILLLFGLILIGLGVFFDGSDGIRTIDPNSNFLEDNNKIVHVSGGIEGKQLLDPMFNIKVKDIALKRIVEVYQWKNIDGNYTKNWSSEIIAIPDSEKYSNPTTMPFLSENWQADSLKIGVHSISDSLKEKIIKFEKYELTDSNFKDLGASGRKAFKLHEGSYFFGLDPNKPRIGDIKVSFEVVKGGAYTILANKQSLNLNDTTSGNAQAKIVKGNIGLDEITKGLNISKSNSYSGILLYLGIALVILAIILIILSLKGGGNKKTKYPQSRKGKKARQEIKDEDDFLDNDLGHEINETNAATATVATGAAVAAASVASHDEEDYEYDDSYEEDPSLIEEDLTDNIDFIDEGDNIDYFGEEGDSEEDDSKDDDSDIEDPSPIIYENNDIVDDFAQSREKLDEDDLSSIEDISEIKNIDLPENEELDDTQEVAAKLQDENFEESSELSLDNNSEYDELLDSLEFDTEDDEDLFGDDEIGDESDGLDYNVADSAGDQNVVLDLPPPPMLKNKNDKPKDSKPIEIDESPKNQVSDEVDSNANIEEVNPEDYDFDDDIYGDLELDYNLDLDDDKTN